VEVEELGSVERLEITVFIEDVVSWEQRLAEPLLDGSFADEHRRVEQWPPLIRRVWLGQADQNGRQPHKIIGQGGERVPTVADESFAEQQVAWQIADECQFGCHCEIGSKAR